MIFTRSVTRVRYNRTTPNKKIAGMRCQSRLGTRTRSGTAGNAFRSGGLEVLSGMGEAAHQIAADDGRRSNERRKLLLMTFRDAWVTDRASERPAIVQNGHARIAVAQRLGISARRKPRFGTRLSQRNGKHHLQIISNREVDVQF